MTGQQTNPLIFLVDDDPINNMINQKLLARVQPNWGTTAFLTAREALDTIGQRLAPTTEALPGIILLDINMPVMNGWDFLQEYREFPTDFRETCQVFILSSSLDKQDISRAREYKEVRDYLTKPLREATLRKILDFNPQN